MLPGFSRGWGKKRGVQKAVRDMNCSCTMCDTFKNVSKTERTKRGMYTTTLIIFVSYDSTLI